MAHKFGSVVVADTFGDSEHEYTETTPPADPINCVLVTKIKGKIIIYPTMAPHHGGSFLKSLTYLDWEKTCSCTPYAGTYPAWTNPTLAPPSNEFVWTGTRRAGNVCQFMHEIGQGSTCADNPWLADVNVAIAEFEYTRKRITGFCRGPGIGDISPFVQDCCHKDSGEFCVGFGGEDGDCTMMWDAQDFAEGIAGAGMDERNVFKAAQRAIMACYERDDEESFCDTRCPE